MKRLGKHPWLALVLLTAACAISPQAYEYYRTYTADEMATYPEAFLDYNTGLQIWQFQDENAGFRVKLNRGENDYGFDITIVNKTAEPMTIHWAQIAYVDINGLHHYMIHNGVNYWDPVTEEIPTTIQAYGQINDLLQPARISDEDGTPRFAPLNVNDIADNWFQSARLLVPISIMGEVKVYKFRLDLEDVPPDLM
ncbi:MAG: hypothetical protein KQJ78_09420 [Deltaproteobacteria bacterium]|nr:hypothetical protein [Deltaproteobacteria bacterium]